jgi:hypothetical protein
MRTATLTLMLSFSAFQTATAQELASAPYTKLRQSIASSVAKSTSVVSSKIRLRVRTTNSDAEPGDLSLWLEVNGDRTELEIAADGTLALPVLEESLAESAWIRSNQPKGTLVFTAIYELDLKLPRGTIVENALVIRYDDLFSANALLRNAETELEDAELGRESQMKAQSIDAIVFSLENPDEPSRVAMKNARSTFDIRPYGRKIYRIPFDQSFVDDPSAVILIPNSGWNLKAEMSPQKTTALKAEPSDRDRGRIAPDPSHTTVHAGPHTAVHLLGASLLQTSDRLTKPVDCRWLLVRVLWTLSQRDINHAPREQEPKGTASFRANPSFIKFLILAEGLRHCFQKHARMRRRTHLSNTTKKLLMGTRQK